MEEKVIVNDVLNSTKLSLKNFEDVIIETSNMELRQTFQNLRNHTESFQYELYKLAESKGYYTSAENVTEEEINLVKNEVINL